jgi:hypothetical protein
MSVDTQQLRAKSIDAILGLWAQELGINVPELMAQSDGVTLTANSQTPGVFLWRRDKDLRIAAQYQKLERIHGAIIGHSFEKILRPEFWFRILSIAEKRSDQPLYSTSTLYRRIGNR